MQVILLENFKRLGNIGEIIKVKNGFARNYLFPNNKAIQATKENIEIFKRKEEVFHKEFKTKKDCAEKVYSKLKDQYVYVIKQAGEDNRLYGSVTSVDIIKAIKDQLKEDLQKNSVQLLAPIKYIGNYNVSINVFADIFANVNVVVLRTAEGAEEEIKALIKAKKEEAKKAKDKEIGEVVAGTPAKIDEKEAEAKTKETKPEEKVETKEEKTEEKAEAKKEKKASTKVKEEKEESKKVKKTSSAKDKEKSSSKAKKDK